MRQFNPRPCDYQIDDRSKTESFRVSVLVPVHNERGVVEAGVRRVLALKHQLVSNLELIVVDDHSVDGTWEILQRLAEEDQRIILLRHESKKGKGAAIRTAVSRATGDVTVIHDGDLEHNPADIPALLVPFAEEGADAVFGSRYVSARAESTSTHRHRHTARNKALTFMSNWFTNLCLTDLETCYKAINTTLLKSIPLRSNDFRFQVEIVFKLAKRRAHVLETLIRGLPQAQWEGKKSRARDGLLALLAMVRFWLIDDLYKSDEYGSQILIELERARRFNLWMGDILRPYVGDRVLEIGAGIGTLTNQFLPRESYVASDVNPNYLYYLRSYAAGKPYLRVAEIDASKHDHFYNLEGQFDTALMVNVLEHVPDELKALRNLWSALGPGGRAVILVPQQPSLYGSLDKALEHRKRYTAADLSRALTESGFRVETVFDFNRIAVPGWWLNGKVLRRKKFSRVQLKVLDTGILFLRRIDRIWPWSGLSLIGIGVKD
ncbi:MAG TPA: bifunctional glycosyltransferase/class I SAM-dependent methyltransferase [Blastocatellia bacterium]|nr:bifunctional glycosyltransferase/class I SAM-dependent methyltransferase [Blastocatellia bacterium]